MKPKIPEGRKKQQQMLFCTECGASLDDFCFSGTAKDIEAVKANQERCKRTGKFHGEMCSKFFIARTELPDPQEDDLPPDV